MEVQLEEIVTKPDEELLEFAGNESWMRRLNAGVRLGPPVLFGALILRTSGMPIV